MDADVGGVASTPTNTNETEEGANGSIQGEKKEGTTEEKKGLNEEDAPRSYAGAVRKTNWDGEPQDAEEDHDNILQKKEHIRKERNSKGIMSFSLSSEFKEKAWKKWRQTLVVKLLGKRVSFDFMRRKIENMWARKGRVAVIDVENGFFLVRFESILDLQAARDGGPWMIQEHYLSVMDWWPEFDPKEAVANRVCAWVRLPSFPTAFIRTVLLEDIGNVIGKFIRTDVAATRIARGKFTCICVELDLLKPLEMQYYLEGKTLEVIYEGLSSICNGCHSYGHLVAQCPLLKIAHGPKQGHITSAREEWRVVGSKKDNLVKKGTVITILGEASVVGHTAEAHSNEGATNDLVATDAREEAMVHDGAGLLSANSGVEWCVPNMQIEDNAMVAHSVVVTTNSFTLLAEEEVAKIGDPTESTMTTPLQDVPMEQPVLDRSNGASKASARISETMEDHAVRKGSKAKGAGGRSGGKMVFRSSDRVVQTHKKSMIPYPL